MFQIELLDSPDRELTDGELLNWFFDFLFKKWTKEESFNGIAELEKCLEENWPAKKTVNHLRQIFLEDEEKQRQTTALTPQLDRQFTDGERLDWVLKTLLRDNFDTLLELLVKDLPVNSALRAFDLLNSLLAEAKTPRETIDSLMRAFPINRGI